MLNEGRQSQSISILATVMALFMGLAVLGGCASSADEGATASGSDEPYPNLGDVPDRPATMTEEQRQQLQQGLVADSQQRAYSEEVIEFQNEPAEPLPAPVETGAAASSEDAAAASSVGEVAMPSAVTPPLPDAPDTPSTAPATDGTASTAMEAPTASAPVSTAAPAPSVAVPPVPQQTATDASPAATDTLAPPSESYTPVPDAPVALAGDGATADLNRAQLETVKPPPQPTPVEAGAAASSADDAAASSVGEGAMPSAVTPPLPDAPDTPSAAPATAVTAATASAPVSTATPAPSIPVPPVPQQTTSDAPPMATYTPPPASYTPVPDAPAALAGDGATADLNRAQLETLQPPPTPVSDTPGGAPGSTAPAQAAGGPSTTTAPTPATPARTPSATTAAAPATVPVTPLPSTGGPATDGAVPTVVASSSGVTTLEEPPSNAAVLDREPATAVAAGGQRGAPTRAAVPGNSVKVATLLFAEGSSDLRDREREIVRTVYERYLSSGRKIRVVGHASGRNRNMEPVRHRMVSFEISADRANAVALELQRLGVPSDRITVVAAADDMPMYYEVMPSGEAGNRRAEIYLE